MYNKKNIKLIVEETAGIERIGEPVTVGIPFPKNVLYDKKDLSISDCNSNLIPLQTEIFAQWPDQSLKWILCDFNVVCQANSVVNYYLNYDGLTGQRNIENIINIKKTDSLICVNTGKAEFAFDNRTFIPFQSVRISGTELIDRQNCLTLLKGSSSDEFKPVINKVDIETSGLLRSTILAEGSFESRDGKEFATFSSRLSFYAGKSVVKVDFTIKNPRAAKHPGGLWDLGDDGSIYFDDLSLCFGLYTEEEALIFWKTKVDENIKKLNGTGVEIYQDSSGGDNWNSINHVNKDGKVMNCFSGYKVKSVSTILEEGNRANPIVIVTSQNISIGAMVVNFWQNSPKSIEAKENKLKIGLFPKQYNDMFELQGGEQKTHTCYISFGQDDSINNSAGLDGFLNPLVARSTPDWHSKCMALGYMAPSNDDKNSNYQKLVNNVINGENSVYKNREIIDEYGWRNFGDIYAEHEKVGYKGQLKPFVSHYNNQYDIIHGCIYQFARTGELKWYELMNNLARHVIDIDIYHTKRDRRAFNGGAFWHTDHFMHAETSTHRSFSKKSADALGLKSYGGGLTPENCYTTGLLKYYFLTGNVMAKDAIIELADWLIDRDKIDMTILGILRKMKHTMSSILQEYAHSPGRCQANAIATLLDAFEVSKSRRYLLKAEKILKKYISPSDDIDKLQKQQIEARWFYLIFLQSIGKYLDIKDGMNEHNKMFQYAKESLLHHAKWMLKNEVPYKQMFHVVEIPSTTWPAHDVRKSAIFDYAYKYSNGSIKDEFLEKSDYFYDMAITDVLSFNDESVTFIRPLAILMNYGVMHTYFQNVRDSNGL